MAAITRSSKHSGTDIDDQEPELVVAAAGGDLAAFDLLVSRYRNRIYRFILKHIDDRASAEDLTQETFIGAFRSLPRFQHNASFCTWLLGIAFNKIRNYRNRAPENRFQFVSDEALECAAAPTLSPCQIFEQKSAWSELKSKIGQLPADLREVLTLAALEGLSYEEIARIMELPVGTVKSKLFRARETLRCSLGEHFFLDGYRLYIQEVISQK